MKQNEWIKSSERKPEQGKKVLCFDNGDIDVRQRFKIHWFPIPYINSDLANLDEPEMWQEIDFPEGYYGYIKVYVEDKSLKMDELERDYPYMFNGILSEMLSHFEKTRKGLDFNNDE